MFFNSKTKEQQQKEVLETTITALRQPDANFDRIFKNAYKKTELADRKDLYHALSRAIHPDSNRKPNISPEAQTRLNFINHAFKNMSSFRNEVLPLLVAPLSEPFQPDENKTDKENQESEKLQKKDKNSKLISELTESIIILIGPSALVLVKHHEYPETIDALVGWIAFAISSSLALTLLATGFILPLPLTISNEILKQINDQLITTLDSTYLERATQMKELNFEKQMSFDEDGESSLERSDEELKTRFNQRFHRDGEQVIGDEFYEEYLNSPLGEGNDTRRTVFLTSNTQGIHNQNAEGYDAKLHIDKISLKDLYTFVRENEMNMINDLPLSMHQTLCLILETYQQLITKPEGFDQKTYQEQATHVLKQGLLVMTLSIVYLPMALSSLLIDNLVENYASILMATAWHVKLASAYLLSSPLYLMEALSPASEPTKSNQEEIEEEGSEYSPSMTRID